MVEDADTAGSVAADTAGSDAADAAEAIDDTDEVLRSSVDTDKAVREHAADAQATPQMRPG